MAVTRVGSATNVASGVTSMSLVAVGAPTAGQLLVITHYASTSQDLMSAPSGFARLVYTALGSTAVLWWKIADGTETATFTVGTTTAVFNGAVYSAWDAGAAWVAPTDASGQTGTGSSVTTTTVTATGATTQADEFVLAAVAISGNDTFQNTWTGGFTAEGLIAGGQRMSVATKLLSATETPSTAESWLLARTPRSVLGSFKIPATGPLPPTGVSAVAVNAHQVDVSWNPAAGATGYDVDRDGTIVVTGWSASPWSDTTVAPSTDYSYRVRTVTA